MAIALTILGALLCAYAGAWLLVLWIGERIWRRWATFDTRRTDAILRAKDCIAIHGTHGPLIEMPDHLKTREEMVAWMTGELLKLTAEKPRP